jgi:hAT family C-terminal dimerisation region
VSCILCVLARYSRWRHNRPSVLSNGQYQSAKDIALATIPRFYPNNQIQPVFVALHPNVAHRMTELKEAMKEKYDADHHHGAAAGAPVEAKIEELAAPPAKRPPGEPDAAVPPAKRHHDEPPASAAPVPAHPLGFTQDIDEGIQMEDEKMEEHDMHWELRQWFSEAAKQLLWNDADSQPSFTWNRDEHLYPRLALLARRFLSILPTSAPSERVWSGFGQIVTKQSASIDSTTAAQTMYLRYNHALLDKAS